VIEVDAHEAGDSGFCSVARIARPLRLTLMNTAPRMSAHASRKIKALLIGELRARRARSASV